MKNSHKRTFVILGFFFLSLIFLTSTVKRESSLIFQNQTESSVVDSRLSNIGGTSDGYMEVEERNSIYSPSRIQMEGTDRDSSSLLIETHHAPRLKAENFFAPSLLVPPSISSISPSSPFSSPADQDVTVFGSNFVSGLTVTVTFPGGGTGTLSGSQILNVTSSSFIMRVTLNGTGVWRIRVNNPNGEQSNTFQFNVITASPPSITSISPSSPTTSNSNQNVNVFGSNFQSGLTVTVFIPGGGTATLSGTQIQNVTSTSFTMVITLNVLGQYGIRVNNPNGMQSGTFNFNTQSPTPTINSISPSNPCARSGDQNVIVSGSNFQSGLTVTVFIPGGGTATLSGSQIQSVSSTQFTMIVTLNVLGQYGIRVNNPNGQQSNIFNFNTQNCNPNISSISPSTPTTSNTDQSVIVNGSNFQSGLTVTVFIPGGGSVTLSGSQIQNVSSTQFTMIITLNIVGQYGIRVNNPNGTQSNTFNFNTQAPTPAITSISPSNPCARSGDQPVNVFGSSFHAGLTVTVFIPGGSVVTLSGAQIQFASSTQFTMIVTLNVLGQYGIRVNNPNGTQSSTFNFNTQNCNPTIDSISPSSPTVGNSDQSVGVSGSRFQSGLTVTVFIPGGSTITLSGSQIQNVSPTQFTMIITLNVLGQYGIRVNNPDGTQSNTFNFNTQTSPPTINSISPSTPTASNVDQNITVNGSNFFLGLTVTAFFPGGGSATLSGTQIQNVTQTSFTMRITLGVAGAWAIRVNNPGGGQSNIFNFTVQNVVQSPAIYSINPATPIVSSADQDVLVSGANFQPGLTVFITFPGSGGTTLSGTQIQNVTSNSFIMRATLSVAGNWTIRVNNPDGGQSPVFGFSVSNGGQNPFINSINPSTPLTNGADQNVIVNGGNFQNGLIVNVTFPNGGIATLQGTGQIQNVTANSFLMRITLNGAGNWMIRVINPNGGQSSQFSFNVQPSGPPPTGLPTSILSPVIGPLRVTTTNLATPDGKWEFNQYKTGAHTPTGGISLSNDTFAWDVNLYTQTSGNADAGKAVFAVADGEVVSYVGTPPGGGPGAVLIAHPNRQNPIWFSGYMHMVNVRVTINQSVNASTIIGNIGRAGVNNEHLHFVIYSGQNSRGNLQSFNAAIMERLANGSNPPAISTINPSTVTQSNDPQLITINGTNFQSNSIIEMQSPSGQYFTITPETVSGLEDESKIVSATSTAITARVAFTAGGTYEFFIINPPLNFNFNKTAESSFAVSSGNTVNSVPSGRTPVIFIPGIMGSRIAKRHPNGSFPELWPAGLFNDDEHRELANEVEDPSNYRPISARNVVPTNIIRNVGVNVGMTDVYGKLIDYLTRTKGYTLYDVPYPTVYPCDTTRTDADLFVFPYDWRNSNFTSARDLWNYVQCIKNIRGNPPNFKVDIIAHSMGGLVARRYILSNPGTHNVDRMVTLGTPWLGAPKVIGVMHNGYYDFWTNRVINRHVLEQIAPYIKGAHELIPSKAYTDDLTTADYGSFPMGEMGWDFNLDQRITTRYNFSLLKGAMNRHYSNPSNYPGDTTDTFHSQPGQDQWNANNLFGVNYYQFVGYGKNTIGTIVAKRDLGVEYLAIANTDGDGTVPLVSATRIGRHDYRGPIQLEKGFPLNHGELASKELIFPFINCVVNVQNANACINGLSNVLGAKDRENFIGEPNYLLKVIGSQSVSISDSFGNTTDPLSTSVDEGVRTIDIDVTGNKYLSTTFPLDQNYKAVIKAPSTPFSIILTKSDDQIITQAIRYIDVSLPANVLALLEITPQGVAILKYDSDGNGTFETPVNPTINVSGTSAQDVEPPNVVVNETVQNGISQIVLEATDAGTGVQRIMYSLNGVTFQQYSTPLSLNPAQTPTIYCFADDQVANRSGLITHNLTTSNVGFSLAAPAIASPGVQITASWNAPSGRPVDDWIGLFRVGDLNSRFIAKQYTNGQSSGSLVFTAPPQPGLYEFRYLLSDGFASVAVSNTINIVSNRAAMFDFDGDDRADVSVFRPSNGYWYISQSSNNAFRADQFGANGDRIAPGDYDGDGRVDTVVFRPSNGYWYLIDSSTGAVRFIQFGQAGDIPVAGYYDVDDKTDIAVYRPSTGTFYFLRSTDGVFQFLQWGQAGDLPVIGDYDGDSKNDFAVFRPSARTFYIMQSSDGVVRTQQWGLSGDKPIAGDFDGDGKTEIAVFRPSTGGWYYLLSSNNNFRGIDWGANGDIPSAADYDGDGKWDIAVFRPSTGTFYILQSTNNSFKAEQFGANGDVPIPAAYVP